MDSNIVKRKCARFFGIGIAAFLLSSCATQPEELQASYTSEVRHQDWARRNCAAWC